MRSCGGNAVGGRKAERTAPAHPDFTCARPCPPTPASSSNPSQANGIWQGRASKTGRRYIRWVCLLSLTHKIGSCLPVGQTSAFRALFRTLLAAGCVFFPQTEMIPKPFQRARPIMRIKATFLKGATLAHFKIDFVVERNACRFQNLCFCRAERLPISKSTLL